MSFVHKSFDGPETHFLPTRVLLPWLCVLLVSCAPVGPDFVKPDPKPPAEWKEQPAYGLNPAAPETTRWWKLFNDPVLDELVDTARQRNNNLEIAGLRVLEARAQLGVAVGAQYPQSQFAQGSATYISPSENTGFTSDFWQYGLGANIAWEIDFWGRFRRGIESADAAYLASIAAYNQAMVLLTAQVVDTYIIIRSTEEQLRIANENAKIQQRSYDIASVLYRNGEDSELDMQQANTLLLSTLATIPALEASLKQAGNALSILLGQAPGTVNNSLGTGSIPSLPKELSVGLPADMLRRRPDVLQAELIAMSQNALVGLAEADLYPSFSLTGSIGLSAGSPGNSSFGDLFTSDAMTFSIGPSFVWPFLNYGRIRNTVRVQDARLQQALVNYRETVLQAARETEDAMTAYIGARQQAEILQQTVASAKRSNELSTLRYREGFSDYQRVLDAQQALFTQQQRLVTNTSETVRSVVSLFKSLGGGWEGEAEYPYVDPKTIKEMQQRTHWGDLMNTPDANTVENGEIHEVDW